MNSICAFCRANETPDGHSGICDMCYDNAGDALERNPNLYAAADELLALARTFKSACDERLSILRDTLDELDEASDDIEDQIGHWGSLRRRCTAVIAKATKADLPKRSVSLS